MLLRIAHVACGIMWVGAAAFYLYLLVPNAQTSAAAGQIFMGNLGPRFGMMMRIVTTITVLSGGLLYVRFFVTGIDWIWRTGPGIGFTVGAVASLISYGMGIAIFGPTQERIDALEKSINAKNESSISDLSKEKNRLEAYLMKNYRIDFVLLVVAVLAMATARYL